MKMKRMIFQNHYTKFSLKAAKNCYNIQPIKLHQLSTLPEHTIPSTNYDYSINYTEVKVTKTLKVLIDFDFIFHGHFSGFFIDLAVNITRSKT